MCGLVGFFGGNGLEHQTERRRLGNMTDAITSRGPDDEGFWIDIEARIAIGHRRLAIIDTSAAGHQPMHSRSDRYVLAFNGEIYNHLDLRKDLHDRGDEPNWKGHSDTETLLAGIEAWGLKKTLEKSVGMFAIALWDRRNQTLTLARDRMGEKPLYYGWQGSGSEKVFLFGSELKAMQRHPSFVAPVSRASLCLLMRHNYIPAPYSIYEGISKLEPGQLLSVSLSQPMTKERYWDMVEVALTAARSRFDGTPEEAVTELEVLAKDAVRRQMSADVPLGAFLSGGVDSSAVVALMQAQSSRPIKTFTIGFSEEKYNEAEYAKAVARHLGTEHTELYVESNQALAVVPLLPSLYCEPFADSSQIPTFLVSQLAKRHVTVSLSGDGGDELFCGYRRYEIADRLWRNLELFPSVLRSGAYHFLKKIPPQYASAMTGGRLSADKFEKGTALLAEQTFDDFYVSMLSHIDRPETWVRDGDEPVTLLRREGARLEGLDRIERMMALDSISYLPDDILVKVDRAAMGVSLEGRVPFLDHRLVEFAWRLPFIYKNREGQGKWPLRQLLYRYVPRHLIERPKKGFAVPLDEWLRTSLRDWAEELLRPERIDNEGFFHAAKIEKVWKEHLSGERNWASHLWNVLMFQAWLETQTHRA